MTSRTTDDGRPTGETSAPPKGRAHRDSLEVFREPEPDPRPPADPEDPHRPPDPPPSAPSPADADTLAALLDQGEGGGEGEPPDPPSAPGSAHEGRVGPRRRRRPRLLGVSGAKGGVGKTLVSSNLAVYLATVGRSVVLVDADPGGANAHTTLGLEHPSAVPPPPAEEDERTRDPRSEWSEDEVVFPGLVDTAIPGLRLLHAGLDEPARGTGRKAPRRRLAQALRGLSADWIVLDLGSGVRRDLLDLWLDLDVGIYVAVPEPTSMENTYRFIRHLFARGLGRRVTEPRAARRLRDRLTSMGHYPAPLDLVRRLDAAGDPLADEVRDAIAEFPFRLVLNEARVRTDLDLGPAMRSAMRRRFGIDIDYLGYVDFDDTVWTAVRARRPLLVESPGTKASKNLEKIARRVVAFETPKARPGPDRTVPPESHHDLLEVERGATDEEVRRAFKRAKETYGPEALCCYGLFDETALSALRARLEEAHDVLLDPARRRPYELSVFPPEVDPVRGAPKQPAHDAPRPPAPVVTPDTEFTGALLRAVRESQGIDLSEISDRTKIGVPHLEAIEGDAFGELPAPVYVRGFVRELAKILRLDPAQVSRSYLRRLRRFLDEQGEGPLP